MSLVLLLLLSLLSSFDKINSLQEVGDMQESYDEVCDR